MADPDARPWYWRDLETIAASFGFSVCWVILLLLSVQVGWWSVEILGLAYVGIAFVVEWVRTRFLLCVICATLGGVTILEPVFAFFHGA